MTIFPLNMVPVLLYYLTGSNYHKVAFIGMLITGAITCCIKYILVKDVSTRPKGAFNCDMPCSDGNQEGQPGMPSSHTSVAVFFASFYILHTTNPYIRAALIGYALLMMRSRYVKRCHNLSQIIAGALLGIGLSVLLNK